MMVVALIVFEYFVFMFCIMPQWFRTAWGITLLLVFHGFFLLMLLAFCQSVMTDPGVVPPNWGFYMGDETKRRRYCKMCNVWKPDRTHHCSICNRCVLNMDHHCPWINNCVGFYNRKFFMQLLFYVYICLLVTTSTGIAWIVLRVLFLIKMQQPIRFIEIWDVCVLVSAMLSIVLLFALTNFIKFHVRLVLENYTTIENLERDASQRSKYDIGSRRNWEQVFGSHILGWMLPFHTTISRPSGDGVRWRVHYTRVVDEDEEQHGAGG